MPMLSSGATDIGKKRKTNQDSICLIPDKDFYAVADGMGGHNGGDIASQTAVAIIPEFLTQNSDLPPKDLITKCIHYINESIFKKSQERPELKGMGTTFSSIYFKDGQLFIGNVGDSRVYLINSGNIYQLSRDHSLVQEKLSLGIYRREEAALDPQKNVLVRSVGFELDLQVDVFNYRVCKNDFFIVCSDGLHARVSDKDILYIVQKNLPDPASATQAHVSKTVKELIHQANENGGNDNISVIGFLAQE